MPGYARSLKKGDTVAARAVVNAVNAANGTPTVNATGDDQMVGVGLFNAIDCVAQCTGAGGSYDIRVWWWYAPAEMWVLDDTIGTVPVSTAGGIEAFPLLGSPNFACATGVYIEILNVAGGGVASVWLMGREA